MDFHGVPSPVEPCPEPRSLSMFNVRLIRERFPEMMPKSCEDITSAKRERSKPKAFSKSQILPDEGT